MPIVGAVCLDGITRLLTRATTTMDYFHSVHFDHFEKPFHARERSFPDQLFSCLTPDMFKDGNLFG
jgi:hypothetical protein